MLVKRWKARVNQPPDSDVKTLGYAFAFFLAAQRAFINADNFLPGSGTHWRAGFWSSWEQTFPSTLPSAVSSLLRFACGRQRSSCAVSGVLPVQFVTSGDAHGEERMGRRVLRVQR